MLPCNLLLYAMQDWHQPASVLKLLLRCVYHMLFTDTNISSIGATAALSSPNPTTSSATTPVPDDVLRRENENLHTLRTAGEVVHVLCSQIARYVCSCLVFC